MCLCVYLARASLPLFDVLSPTVDPDPTGSDSGCRDAWILSCALDRLVCIYATGVRRVF